MLALLAFIATLLTSFLPILNKVLLRAALPSLVAWAINAASLPLLAAGTILLTQCSFASKQGISCAASIPKVDLLFFPALLGSEQPIALDIVWLPLRFGALLSADDLAHQPIYRLLEMNFGVLISSNTFHLTAVAATAKQASLLAIPAGTPVLLIQRISVTLQGEQVYLQDRYYRPDRVHYVATLQRPGGISFGKQNLQHLHPIFTDHFNP
jgi:hypothetical protein